MSYTTQITYTGDGSTDTYSIPFPFLRASDLNVTVDGVEEEFTRPSNTTITFSTPPGNGDAIVITRETNIDDSAVDFSDDSSLFAADLDAAVDQCLYKLQELETLVTNINVGGEDLPVPGAASRFLVSSDATNWTVRTVAQVQTLLGINVATVVPTAVAGNYFVVTNLSTNTYELQTPAQIKTLLGISSNQLPALTLGNGFITSNTGGTAYELSSPASARTKLGLGECAQLNEGVAIGEVPRLISRVNTGGGITSALPAVSGENLVDVATALDFAVYEKSGGGTLTGSYASVSASATQITAPAGGWLTISSNEIRLNPGVYDIHWEFAVLSTSLSTGRTVVDYQIHTGSNGTPATVANVGSMQVDSGADASSQSDKGSIRTILTVASPNSTVTLQGKVTSGSATVIANGSRVTITRISD